VQTSCRRQLAGHDPPTAAQAAAAAQTLLPPQQEITAGRRCGAKIETAARPPPVAWAVL